MNHTARNFALQLGSLVSLYVSLTSLAIMLFSVITIAFPDAADSYYTYESAASSIRLSLATLIVFFPTYLWLTRKVNQTRRDKEEYLSVTRWLVYLSLLVGGGILLGDLVSVIYVYLEGDITIRFILKVLTLLVIIGSAFFYYLKDAQDYWQKHEKQSVQYGLAAAVIVLASVVLGFMHVEPPEIAREMLIDDNQISDLSGLQFQIEDYYRLNQSLPENLSDITFAVEAPEGRAPYTYNKTGDLSYELCAEFAHASIGSEMSRAMPVMEKNYNWQHEAGQWCFERVIVERNL